MEKYIQIILTKEEKQKIEQIKKSSLNKWVKFDKIEKIKQNAINKNIEIIYKDFFNSYKLKYTNYSLNILSIKTKNNRYYLNISPHYYGKGLNLALYSNKSKDFILLKDEDLWNPKIIIDYFELFIEKEEKLNSLLINIENDYKKNKEIIYKNLIK